MNNRYQTFFTFFHTLPLDLNLPFAAMLGSKDTDTTVHAEHLAVGSVDDDKQQSLVVANEALTRFQKHQHSMTLKESLKESWKPLLWCK